MSHSTLENQPSDLIAFYRLALSAIIPQALAVVAKLKIADLLKEGEKTTEQLANLTNTYEPFLYRIMRILAGEGVFKETAPRTFMLASIGEFLCSGHPKSLSYVPLTNVDTWRWHTVEHLLDSVKDGKPTIYHSHGFDNYYDFLAKNPTSYDLYNKGMAGTAHNFHVPFVEKYDFSQLSRIVDIGGGEGRLLSSILKSNPHLQGILLETAHTLTAAKSLLEVEGVLDRCELVEGDFLESIPAGGDLYLMSYVSPDWGDDALVKLLRNVHKVAYPEHSKLLVLDSPIPLDNEFHLSKWIDVILLTFGYGRLRTKPEFAQIYQQSHFNWVNTLELSTPVTVMELEPI